jgi:nucleoid DNA-binding protein
MEIAECIAELLLKGDKVTISGLGVLKTEWASATIHPVENSFLPPNKKVIFESAAIADDEILAKSLEKENGIRREEALAAIKNFVSEIKNSLQEKGAYEVRGVGKFYYNIEKHLQFAPLADMNFLLSSFGLQEFVSKPILRPENISGYSVNKPVIEKKKKRKFIWFRF